MPPIHGYARAAGALGLLSIVGGGFGEAYVPAMLVIGRDAATTASQILRSESLFRWGFAGYLVEALCDVGLSLLFYVILRVVRRDIAMLAVFFRLIGTAGFAMAQAFYFSALLILRDAGRLREFSPEQLSAIARLSLDVSAHGQTLFSMFYGVGSILLGYLISRSGFLPKFLGILLAISGIGFVAKTVTWVLAPSYSSPLLLAPAGLAALALTLWLIFKGVDIVKWNTQAALTESR